MNQLQRIERHLLGMCDEIYYPPNERVGFTLRIESLSSTSIMLCNFIIDFQTCFNQLQNVQVIINREQISLQPLNFFLPSSLTYGRIYFTIKFDIFYSYNQNWEYYKSDQCNNPKFFVEIRSLREISTSRYNIFISRSNTEEDQFIGEFIERRIRGWNILTNTVKNVPDNQASIIIREKIERSDGLIVIAIPRNLDHLTQTWKTLNWLNNEVGIAYGRDKPLLILQENSVELGALPKYLTTLNGVPRIVFNRNNLEKLLIDIDNYMPFFRSMIKNKLNDNFVKSLFNSIGTAVLGVTIYEVSKKFLNINSLNKNY